MTGRTKPSREPPQRSSWADASNCQPFRAAYAHHAAWIEDHRRLDNGTLARWVVSLGLASQPSRVWAGYWQRAA